MFSSRQGSCCRWRPWDHTSTLEQILFFIGRTLPYLTYMYVNLLFKRWHKPCLVFEVLGGCRTQLVTQECGISWEHLWETGISHFWGYYLDTWLQHKTSHVNIDFHRGNCSSWAVSTYFKSASPLLSSLAAEQEAWPCAGDPIALATTDERWNDWTVLCSPSAILASPGWVSAGFWQSLMWWQAC